MLGVQGQLYKLRAELDLIKEREHHNKKENKELRKKLEEVLRDNEELKVKLES